MNKLTKALLTTACALTMVSTALTGFAIYKSSQKQAPVLITEQTTVKVDKINIPEENEKANEEKQNENVKPADNTPEVQPTPVPQPEPTPQPVPTPVPTPTPQPEPTPDPSEWDLKNFDHVEQEDKEFNTLEEAQKYGNEHLMEMFNKYGKKVQFVIVKTAEGKGVINWYVHK